MDSGRKNTFYIAGLAYDAHTKDFRTDLTGDQTVSTFWLDVLESPTVNCMVTPLPTNCSVQNQYMLAAKYGGFDVPAGYTPYSGTPTWTAANNSSWDENKDGLPDTYFKANDPKLMKDSLEEAFNNIISKLGKSSSSFVVSSPNIATSNMSFGATFDASGWTGNVRGNNITFSGGLPVETLAWNAVDKLELQNWNTGRYIATANCTSGNDGKKSCTGKPFRLASLSSTDQAYLGSTTTDQQNVLNFLRGDGSNEIDAGGTDMYRNCVKKLGISWVPRWSPSVHQEHLTATPIIPGIPHFSPLMLPGRHLFTLVPMTACCTLSKERLAVGMSFLPIYRMRCLPGQAIRLHQCRWLGSIIEQDISSPLLCQRHTTCSRCEFWWRFQ